MLDLHVKKGYLEVLPPALVNTASLTGSGQLPKFAEESFRCADDDLWLTPTAEVPITSLHRGEIIPKDSLPLRYVAYSPCFRREAGSYGSDVRGLNRLHQFDKVEIVIAGVSSINIGNSCIFREVSINLFIFSIKSP